MFDGFIIIFICFPTQHNLVPGTWYIANTSIPGKDSQAVATTIAAGYRKLSSTCVRWGCSGGQHLSYFEVFFFVVVSDVCVFSFSIAGRYIPTGAKLLYSDVERGPLFFWRGQKV